MMRALTLGVKIWAVLWKHQSTMPPLLKIVKRSSIVTTMLPRRWLMVRGSSSLLCTTCTGNTRDLT